MYVDALKPPSLLSLILQEEGRVDIVQGIKSILKASNSLQAMVTQNPLTMANC